MGRSRILYYFSISTVLSRGGMSARSGGHHCNKTSDISDIPSYILAGSPAIQKIPLRFIRTSLMHSKCFYDSGPVRCGLGLIQSWLRIQPSQTSAGEHLRLFFPRRPRLLCTAYPSILTPTHPRDGTDHRAIPFFTEVTEHEPYRPMAQRYILPRRRLRAGNKAVCRHTAHPP